MTDLFGDPLAPELGDRFDEWYEIYPVKRSKKDARKAWNQVRGDEMADMLIADVQKRIRYDQAWLRGAIPYPATYLRGERWEDELTVPENRREAMQPRTDDDWLRIGKQFNINPRPGETMQSFKHRVSVAMRGH